MRGERKVGNAAAIEQHERGLIAEPAQRRSGESRLSDVATLAAQRLRLVEGAEAHRRRDRVDELGRGLNVRPLDLFAGDRLDGQCRFAVEGRDVASRHDHLDAAFDDLDLGIGL